MKPKNLKKLAYLQFYQEQLRGAFYRKRGKATSLPHIFYVIQQLLDQSEMEYVSVLDVGCARGDLLYLLESTFGEITTGCRVKFFGLDYDQKAIAEAQKQCKQAQFSLLDLTKAELLREHTNKYDLVTSINTIHEVFSEKMLEYKDKKNAFEQAQEYIRTLFGEISNIIKPNGRIVLYDGLDVPKGKQKDNIYFSFKQPEYELWLHQFIKEYYPLRLKYSKDGDIFSMTSEHFLRFISTIKYFNTPLWSIESQQMYAYFDRNEYIRCLEECDFDIEVVIEIANDLDIWSEYVTLHKNSDFPSKSIIIVAKKREGDLS